MEHLLVVNIAGSERLEEVSRNLTYSLSAHSNPPSTSMEIINEMLWCLEPRGRKQAFVGYKFLVFSCNYRADYIGDY